MTPTEQLDTLIDMYNKMFKQCYDALAADTPQEKRDSLREAISGFLTTPDTEE
jgi:phosphate uptake regulator